MHQAFETIEGVQLQGLPEQTCTTTEAHCTQPEPEGSQGQEISPNVMIATAGIIGVILVGTIAAHIDMGKDKPQRYQ